MAEFKVTPEMYFQMRDICNKKSNHGYSLYMYHKQGFLKRLFSKKPLDPAPSFSEKELSEFKNFLFRMAYPDLNFSYLNANGERIVCNTSFREDNCRELVSDHILFSRVESQSSNLRSKGVGSFMNFVHNEVHNLDSEDETDYTKEKFFSSDLDFVIESKDRISNPIIDEYYNRLDAFIQEIHSHCTSFSREEDLSLLKKTDVLYSDYLKSKKDFSKLLLSRKETRMSTCHNLVYAYKEMLEINSKVSRVSFDNYYERYLLARYDSLRDAINSCNLRQVFENSRKSYVMRSHNIKDTSVLFKQTQDKAAFYISNDPDKYSYLLNKDEVMRLFVQDALVFGFPLDKIIDTVKLKDKSLSESDFVLHELDTMSIDLFNQLFSYLDNAFKENMPDFHVFDLNRKFFEDKQMSHVSEIEQIKKDRISNKKDKTRARYRQLYEKSSGSRHKKTSGQKI